MKYMQKISARLIVCSGAAVLAILFVAIVFMVLDTKRNTEASVYAEAEFAAKNAANDVAMEMSQLNAALSTTASTIGSANATGMNSREVLLATLKSVADKYAWAFGVAMLEEQGAWDGKSGKDLLGNNDAGDFGSYFSKEKGESTYSSIPTTRDQEWYKVPATTRQPIISKPYSYKLNGKSILMTTISHPVQAGGKLLGVAAIDIDLEMLSTNLAAMHPLGEGRVMLVSGEETWLAHPDPSLRMTQYEGVGEPELKEALKTGAVTILHNFQTPSGSVERVVYPFKIPGLQATWAAIVEVPSAVIDNPVRLRVSTLVVAGIVTSILLLMALYMSVAVLVRNPMRSLLQSVQRMSAGDFDMAVTNRDRLDEIGILSNALEEFRGALMQGKQAEDESQRQRAAAEAVRDTNDAERQRSLLAQTYVVDQLGEALRNLSRCNLRPNLNDQFPPEFDQLRRDYNLAIRQLNDTLVSVSDTIRSVHSGAKEISNSADELAQRTAQQAVSLEQTAAALDEVTTNVISSSKLVCDAQSEAAQAKERARQSRAVVAEAMEAMDTIQKSSDRISSIIGVIDEMSFQTNLLALNAGVEAARAGEAGKGFAVVAQEVRELAQRSAQAAKEIKDLIGRSSEEVSRGVKLVTETGAVLNTIDLRVESMNLHMISIAASSQEQSSALSAVNAAMNQMDQVTQQNATMVEETNLAGRALENEAMRLQSLISRFQLGEMPKSSRKNSSEAAA